MKYYCYILMFILSMVIVSCEDNERNRDHQENTDNDKENTDPLPSEKTVGQKVIFNIDGNFIRVGNSKQGEVLYTIDDDYIRAGEGTTGDIVYNIDGYYIRVGEKKTGSITYTFDGKTIRTRRDGDNFRVFELNGSNISLVENDYANKNNKIYNINIASQNGRMMRFKLYTATGNEISEFSFMYYIDFKYENNEHGIKLLGGYAYMRTNEPIYTIKFNNTTLHPTSAKIYAGDGTSLTANPIYNITISYRGTQMTEANIYAGSEISSKSYLYTILFNKKLDWGEVYSFY